MMCTKNLYDHQSDQRSKDNNHQLEYIYMNGMIGTGGKYPQGHSRGLVGVLDHLWSCNAWPPLSLSIDGFL